MAGQLSGATSEIALVGIDLFKPFEFEFFRNGVFVATLAGALCGVVGCYVVLRNMSYIGHGLSHAIFGGYAVAGLIGTWSRACSNGSRRPQGSATFTPTNSAIPSRHRPSTAA